jgi:hypothetical protein
MKPRRRVSGCKLDGSFKARVLETQNFADVFVYKTTSNKETIGNEYTGIAGFGKKLCVCGAATPGRQSTCFTYNSCFVFWLCQKLM